MKAAGLFGDLESIIEQPKDKGILLKDVLEAEVDEKYFLSENAVKMFVKYSDRKQSEGCGFKFEPTIGNKKSKILTTKPGTRTDDNFIIDNTMPRSSTTGKGGTGHLNRNDGKTYCLDTGNTNAVEIKQSIRRLLPIECERLQTVKDNYTNHVSDSQRYKMLGNGWTVDVITHIFKYLK